MRSDFDLAIIGSGFSGSLLAMIARRMGRSVILLERGEHPRFAIGESTSPLMNLIIEQMAERYDLPRLKPLTTWGEWQRHYPQVVGGVKRGFTYFKHEVDRPYRPSADRSNQLLVSASPVNEIADSHWLRSDVDHFLQQEAVALGVEYLDRTSLQSVEWANGHGAKLSGEQRGKPVEVRAGFVVDASGPRGFLSRALNLPNRPFREFPATQALYTHFTGVHRCDQMPDYDIDEQPPYPMDDAAVHHVFDGGWMWVLRFNNGVTSAGIAVEESLATELRLSEGEPAWRRFLSKFPSLAAQFADAQPTREFIWSPNLPFRSETAAGPGWAMAPSAAAFIDPLFSSGMPLALLGVERLGRMFEEKPGDAKFDLDLREYSRVTLAEADHTADFIAGCYASFPRFENFTSLSMIYFAAASYCEMARRLGRGHLATRFLASDHTSFASATGKFSQLLRRKGQVDPGEFSAQVKQKIDCLNIAGLCEEQKQNWYDVNLDDVIRSAEKLGLTPAQMRKVVRTASWAPSVINLEQYGSGNSGIEGLDSPELPDDNSAAMGDMVGSSPAFRQALEDIQNVADTEATVLLRGETGTGKELAAHAIHAQSGRRHRPFVIVNCAALPASLIESELFGYEKGAFTGASLPKPGRFELADGGTIFLDEIGEVPLEIQGRFLRVLQTGVFERLGGVKSVRVRVRIIAATNQSLEQLINEGKFRADLFYRLNVFPLTLPPLRERAEDIRPLVHHFVKKYNRLFKRSINSISAQSLYSLEEYHWPGNIRELEHLVERAVLASKGGVLKVSPPTIRIEPARIANETRPMPSIHQESVVVPEEKKSLLTLAENEGAYIDKVLRHTGGRISGPQGAAEILGIPPSTLRSRIKKLGMKTPKNV
jgi:FADH2 O2-dependent halogenase